MNNTRSSSNTSSIPEGITGKDRISNKKYE